jgi:hypothetical protein
MSDFDQFVRERIYPRSTSPRTADFYRDSWVRVRSLDGVRPEGGNQNHRTNDYSRAK